MPKKKKLITCISNLKDKRSSIFALTKKAIEIFNIAWPKANETAEVCHNLFMKEEAELLNKFLMRAIKHANERLS